MEKAELIAWAVYAIVFLIIGYTGSVIFERIRNGKRKQLSIRQREVLRIERIRKLVCKWRDKHLDDALVQQVDITRKDSEQLIYLHVVINVQQHFFFLGCTTNIDDITELKTLPRAPMGTTVNPDPFPDKEILKHLDGLFGGCHKATELDTGFPQPVVINLLAN